MTIKKGNERMKFNNCFNGAVTRLLPNSWFLFVWKLIRIFISFSKQPNQSKARTKSQKIFFDTAKSFYCSASWLLGTTATTTATASNSTISLNAPLKQ